jgi:hypothetical protein
MHETKALEIIIRSHTNKVVFNVISSQTNLIIIGLYRFVLHNPQLHSHMRNFHFEAPREEVSKCKGLLIGLFGENQDSHLGALKDDPKFD